MKWFGIFSLLCLTGAMSVEAFFGIHSPILVAIGLVPFAIFMIWDKFIRKEL